MANDAQTRFHEEWLGLAQPYEGLVFSVPVLADAQITPQVGADLTIRFRRHLVKSPGSPEAPAPGEVGTFGHLPTFFESFLGYTQAGALLLRDALPPELSFYAQEGQQELRPSFALARSLPVAPEADLFAGFGDEPEPQAKSDTSHRSSSPYLALVWDLRDDCADAAPILEFDKPEDLTGPWRYPPTAKFERLLRAVGVPVGLLCNGQDLRLVYAPPGESTSHLTFRGEFMQRPEGRPILAAFELLLNAQRSYQAAPEFTFEGLLKESRSRQADVTKELASQVFEAVELLLAGFEAAANRDSTSGRLDSLRAALEAPHDHAYQGVLSVVLRLVFVLYAEDQGLLPVQHETYANHLSVKGLYDELVADTGQHPESMHHRFGAYGRLLSLFRAVFYGVEHGELKLPPRRGRLFDPNSFPFLEGGLPGSTAAYRVPEERAASLPPSVDDGTVYEVLHRLVFFQGQRLSYASLDVEQLGSVYESLMGFHILRTTEPAVRLGKSGLWVEVGELRKAKAADRKQLLKEEAGLSAAQLSKVEEWLKQHKEAAPLAEALNDLSPGGKKQRHKHRASSGRLVLQPGEERRRSGSHYTPRTLTEGIVRRTLEPLLKCVGEAPTEEQILSLKICDPAMGSGAFLVEVVRQLAAKLVEVWTREKRLGAITEQHTNPHLYASRLVAQRCIYGVDKNAAAVELAKLSLWLVTLSADLPFTFVDHALRHGDSLVGLSLDQVSSFHWKPEKQVPLFQQTLKDSLDQALEHRAELLELSKDDTPRTQDERRRLLDHADQATDRIRVIADICVGAFFAETKDKARNSERVRRMDLVELWLKGEASVEAELRELAADAREKLSPFHWMLEFPEVFYLERPDPLDGGRVNGAAMMDGFVGNPPFMGGMRISNTLGDRYLSAIRQFASGGGDRTDLSAYFFLRCARYLGSHGVMGFIATNSIGEGDTREHGLARLVSEGFSIVSAVSNAIWPGAAAVHIAKVHLAIGHPAARTDRWLNGAPVAVINSALHPGREQRLPERLRANDKLSYIGVKVYGQGFLLPCDEVDTHAQSAQRAQLVRPYLGGREVNTSPSQSHSLYVIDFGDMTLAQASCWPELLDVVRARVKPERDRVKRTVYRKNWWLFAEPQRAMRTAIAALSRCLVASQVTKHLCFSFQPTDRVFSQKLLVFPIPEYSAFGVLQSRVHTLWGWRQGSTLKSDLSYPATDCFETFPFPAPDPRTVIPELETLGEKLYAARAAYMAATNQGLTKTYNALKDPACTDERILELRLLHEEMDRAVLRAYPPLPRVSQATQSPGAGQASAAPLPDPDATDPQVVGWSDIEVPPFCIATDADKAALQAFEDEVLDRLFVLNELRAKEEAAQVKKPGPKGKKANAKNKAPSKEADPPGEASDDQGSLF